MEIETINPIRELQGNYDYFGPGKFKEKIEELTKPAKGNLNHKYLNSKVQQYLFNRYASSQNYYYTKDLNEFLGDSRSGPAFVIKDFEFYLEDDEYMNRVYEKGEYKKRIKLLTEYYKYHNDVPRLFMMPIAEVIHNFYDKKRRLNYIKVTKMLKGKVDWENLKDDDDSSSDFEPKSFTMTDSLQKILPQSLINSLYKMKSKAATSRQGRNSSTSQESNWTIKDLNTKLTDAFDNNSVEFESFSFLQDSYTNRSRKGNSPRNHINSVIRSKALQKNKMAKNSNDAVVLSSRAHQSSKGVRNNLRIISRLKTLNSKLSKENKHRKDNVNFHDYLSRRLSSKESGPRLWKERMKTVSDKDNFVIKSSSKGKKNNFLDKNVKSGVQNLNINNINININIGDQKKVTSSAAGSLMSPKIDADRLKCEGKKILNLIKEKNRSSNKYNNPRPSQGVSYSTKLLKNHKKKKRGEQHRSKKSKNKNYNKPVSASSNTFKSVLKKENNHRKKYSKKSSNHFFYNKKRMEKLGTGSGESNIRKTLKNFEISTKNRKREIEILKRKISTDSTQQSKVLSSSVNLKKEKFKHAKNLKFYKSMDKKTLSKHDDSMKGKSKENLKTTFFSKNMSKKAEMEKTLKDKRLGQRKNAAGSFKSLKKKKSKKMKKSNRSTKFDGGIGRFKSNSKTKFNTRKLFMSHDFKIENQLKNKLAGGLDYLNLGINSSKKKESFQTLTSSINNFKFKERSVKQRKTSKDGTKASEKQFKTQRASFKSSIYETISPDVSKQFSFRKRSFKQPFKQSFKGLYKADWAPKDKGKANKSNSRKKNKKHSRVRSEAKNDFEIVKRVYSTRNNGKKTFFKI